MSDLIDNPEHPSEKLRVVWRLSECLNPTADVVELKPPRAVSLKAVVHEEVKSSYAWRHPW